MEGMLAAGAAPLSVVEVQTQRSVLPVEVVRRPVLLRVHGVRMLPGEVPCNPRPPQPHQRLPHLLPHPSASRRLQQWNIVCTMPSLSLILKQPAKR
jgi:hypothetical protein